MNIQLKKLENKHMKVAQWCPTLQPHGLYSPWNSPGQINGLGSLSLLRENKHHYQ